MLDVFIPIFERVPRFSTLQRVEIAEIACARARRLILVEFQYSSTSRNCRNFHFLPLARRTAMVSVLFNESKLPKFDWFPFGQPPNRKFQYSSTSRNCRNLQALAVATRDQGFSTLQRVEIAEIRIEGVGKALESAVSVLFNESKLPKYKPTKPSHVASVSFSTLQRVEIAEM